MSDLMRQREDEQRRSGEYQREQNRLAGENIRLRLALLQIRRETACDVAWRVAMDALHPELKDAA